MSELRADTITASDGTSPVTLTKQEAAKAWSNIGQIGTQVIRDSFNISSISDIAVGRTQITVTSSFANNTYHANLTLRMQSTVSNAGSCGGIDTSDGTSSITTSQHQLSYRQAGGADTDTPYGGSLILGDLA